MTQQTIGLAEPASATAARELAETDLERIAAGKDGDYGWIGIYSGKESRRLAQLHPSPERFP
jgi:hypothetical protein